MYKRIEAIKSLIKTFVKGPISATASFINKKFIPQIVARESNSTQLVKLA